MNRPPARRRMAPRVHRLETLEVRTLLAAGDLDPSFDGDGVVDTVINGQVSASTRGYSIVLLSDGKSLASGDAILSGQQRVILTRFNSNGSVDGTFGTDGTITLPPGRMPKIALDSTGGTLIAYQDDSTGNLRVQRLTAAGTLDATYAGDGVAETSDGNSPILGVHVGNNDQLTVMAGEFVSRFTASGLPETTFGGTGRISVRANNPVEVLTGFVVETSGAIVVVGYRTSFDQTAKITIRTTRYGSDGAADPTYGNQGAAETTLSGFIPASVGTKVGAPSRDSSGSLLLPVNVVGGTAILRLGADGKQDVSFGTGGQTVLGYEFKFPENAIVRVLPQGGAVIAATLDSSSQRPDWVFARLLTDGTLDPSFGNSGVLTLNPGDRDYVTDCVASASGEIVGLGLSDALTGNKQMLLARVTARGESDTTFGNNGIVAHVYRRLGPAEVFSGGAAIQTDGKIVVAGWTKETEFVVTRHNSDGTLDTTFGSGGSQKVSLPPARDPQRIHVAGVAVDSQGRIVVAGHNGNEPRSFGLVLRLLSNGSRDAAFGTDGVVQVVQLGSIGGLALEPDDRIVLAGVDQKFSSNVGDAALVRLTAEGALDVSFGSLGVATTPGAVSIFGMAFARGEDGKYVVAARINDFVTPSTQPKVVRWFANGSLDASFGARGVREYSSASRSTYYTIRSVLVDSVGRITVGAGIGINESIEAVRFLPDGTIDSSFGAQETPGFVRLNAIESATLVQLPDDRYLAASGIAFLAVDGENVVFRHTPSGAADTTWGSNGRLVVEGPIRLSPAGRILAVQPDGRVILFGTHTPDGQPTSLRLIRLQAEPGVITSARRTQTTSESGTTATFDIRLSSKPTADVTISVTSSDTTEGTVSTSSLTFTPDNWSTAQTVTITGVDDSLFDADQRYRILLGPATSTDANYNGKTIAPVEVRNRDDETLRFFRSFNPQANFHFFTTSVSEFQGVQPNGYNDESSGRGGFSLAATQATGFTQLFRLYNLQKGYHYYTASVAERDFLLSLNPSTTDPNFGKIGWRFEGSPGFIADTQQAGTSQVFRLYNKTSGAHLFTENPAVRAAVLQSPEWQEHAPLGFAFLVDDAAPTTPAPPPTPVLVESMSETKTDKQVSTANVASLVAVPSGSRFSVPAIAAAASAEPTSHPLRAEPIAPDFVALDLYLTDFVLEPLELTV